MDLLNEWITMAARAYAQKYDTPLSEPEREKILKAMAKVGTAFARVELLGSSQVVSSCKSIMEMIRKQGQTLRGQGQIDLHEDSFDRLDVAYDELEKLFRLDLGVSATDSAEDPPGLGLHR
ncbi:hypothetical protein ACFQ1S_01620 [Kibdelosporangium lantanae]|uniref:Uncharacterized protein n=1 Tax=Kibdelosporangium lantanae TaxID=1497396 RepID=A0ABW3M266_9PSEU